MCNRQHGGFYGERSYLGYCLAETRRRKLESFSKLLEHYCGPIICKIIIRNNMVYLICCGVAAHTPEKTQTLHQALGGDARNSNLSKAHPAYLFEWQRVFTETMKECDSGCCSHFLFFAHDVHPVPPVWLYCLHHLSATFCFHDFLTVWFCGQGLCFRVQRSGQLLL